jgi:hypothetical protein
VLVAQLLWGVVAVRHGRGLAWAQGKFQGLRHFSAARTQMQQPLVMPAGQPLPTQRVPRRGSDQSREDPELLDQALRSNEQLIRAASQDKYWKLYFLLTGGAK